MSKQLFKGPGLGTSEWREAFVLTDTDSVTPLFKVDTDGTVTMSGSFSPTGNVAITGTLSASGDFAINTSKFTVAASTGNTLAAGTLSATGDFAVATNKFTVTAASGNTAVAGTLAATGDFSVATNKFTVAAASGNTAVAGTLAVTGLATFSAGLALAAAQKIDASALGGADAVVKFTETTDTPTVAWTDSGAANHAPTTAPHGYLKVLVGATPYYIPAWA